jgi:hypothetical protein
MGARIHYRKLATEDPCLQDAWAPSELIRQLEAVFGSFPVKLGSAHVQKLEALAAIWNDSSHNPYKEILNKISELGAIELYATY